MKRKFRITIEITVPAEHVDEDRIMFQLTNTVEGTLGNFFPGVSWDDKKYEVGIKDLNP